MSNARYTDYYVEPSITGNMLSGILDAVEQGLADEDMPLTSEQSAFLANAIAKASA